MSDPLTLEDAHVKAPCGYDDAIELAAEVVKEFEQGPDGGFAKELYECPGGEWTIGYGHAMRNDTERQFFEAGCDEATADRLLTQDLAKAADAVHTFVKYGLTVHQKAALISFAFNVGRTNFGTSTLVRKVNAGAIDEVPRELARWKYAKKKVLAGLVRRRHAETLMGEPWVQKHA